MIYVTGASGFVGRSVMKELSRQGHDAHPYSGRMNDSFRLGNELKGAKTVIHLAGAEARDRVRLLNHVDVDGTQQLLRECNREGVDRFIYTSRINANAYSSFALLRAKGQIEKIVERSGVQYTIIRSATLFGRDDRFLNVVGGLAAWTWPLVWIPGGGEVAMQPLWVEDLVRCILSSIDRPDLVDRTITVSGEERMKYKDIVRLVLSAASLRRRFVSPSVKIARPLSAVLFGWWRKAPVTRFFMDRLIVPEVAPVDSIWTYYRFRPSHLNQQIAYLRRSGLRWRLFRSS